MLRYAPAGALAAALALAALPAHTPAQELTTAQRATIERDINDLKARLRAAAGKLDAAALYAAVLDTETPPIIEDGRLFTPRATALANTAAGFQALQAVSYHYAREHLTILSPVTVLSVAEGTGTGTLADGRELQAPFAETIVFVLRDGQWKVLHAHRSTPNTR